MGGSDVFTPEAGSGLLPSSGVHNLPPRNGTESKRRVCNRKARSQATRQHGSTRASLTALPGLPHSQTTGGTTSVITAWSDDHIQLSRRDKQSQEFFFFFTED